MTSLKTKSICFLAAFLFLSIVPTLAEVVKSVSECKGVLLEETPPHIPGVLENNEITDNRYKVICQKYETNVPRYLTVYDTENKIPVFSAYEYKKATAEMGAGAKKGAGAAVRDWVNKDWMIEPQLENGADQKDMKDEEKGKTYTNQAVNADYKENDQECNRGHLFPASHASSEDDKISTYTLTNIVPQKINFNGVRWANMEQCIKSIMENYVNKGMKCFVVVGAEPGVNKLNKQTNEKVKDGEPSNNKKEINIPSMMWSAFYCYDTKSWVAGAHWDENKDKPNDKHLVMQTLEKLKDNTWKKGIEPFPYLSTNAFHSEDIKDKLVGDECNIP